MRDIFNYDRDDDEIICFNPKINLNFGRKKTHSCKLIKYTLLSNSLKKIWSKVLLIMNEIIKIFANNSLWI